MTGLQTEFAFEARVTISPAVTVGPSASGLRRMIPITGGTFEGPRLKGDVVPGGADWQLVRPDGAIIVEAIYMLRELDGSQIYIHNWGLIVPPEGSGDKPPGPDSPPPYIRTSPRFEAPIGKHDWLNKSLFLGTIRAEPDLRAVIIGVHRLL